MMASLTPGATEVKAVTHDAIGPLMSIEGISLYCDMGVLTGSGRQGHVVLSRAEPGRVDRSFSDGTTTTLWTMR